MISDTITSKTEYSSIQDKIMAQENKLRKYKLKIHKLKNLINTPNNKENKNYISKLMNPKIEYLKNMFRNDDDEPSDESTLIRTEMRRKGPRKARNKRGAVANMKRQEDEEEQEDEEQGEQEDDEQDEEQEQEEDEEQEEQEDEDEDEDEDEFKTKKRKGTDEDDVDENTEEEDDS